MRARLLALLGLVTLALAGCGTYPGPSANCFALVAGDRPCDFQPVADIEGAGP